MNIQGVIKGSMLAFAVAFAAGCIVTEPREGYYDHEHNRYYREHAWHECTAGDEHCR